MPSAAFEHWSTVGMARLDELERVHADATGAGRGRRWGTEQLNRSLFVVLVAQFQRYCRDLHNESIAVHVAHANPRQAGMLRTLLERGRRLDVQTPRVSTLGSDFGRLGLLLVDSLKADGPAAERALHRLDVLVDFRNAVGHGNETEVSTLVAAGQIRATKQSYRGYRRTLQELASSMDRVVADDLASVLEVSPPW